MGYSEYSDVTKAYLERFYCILDDMISEMTTASLTNSISHNFITQMIPHHRAAIEMSGNLLQYTTFIPLQIIAKNIIAEQTKSIQDMEAIIRICSRCCNTECELTAYNENIRVIMEEMFTEMGEAPSVNNININFMREMIPHHQGAIRMSEQTLQYQICPELNPILESIITSQKRGVKEMKELLRCCKCSI